MTKYDITKYDLKELKEAFNNIDDVKYPERAAKLYLQIQKYEKKENSLRVSKPNNLFFKFNSFLFSIFDSLNHRNWIEFKEEEFKNKKSRVSKLISEKESSI